MEIERVKIGVVGVDSGQLMIIDPCYLEHTLPDAAEAQKKIGVTFWGADESAVAEAFPDAEKQKDGTYAVPCGTSREQAEAVLAKITDWVAAHHSGHCCQRITDVGNTYDMICKSAHGSGGSGQINYAAGHPGLAVNFHPGVGDGCYEVWAEFVHLEGWDRRIAKVEIICLPEVYEEETCDTKNPAKT